MRMKSLVVSLLAIFVFPLTLVAMPIAPCADCHTMHNSQNNDEMVDKKTGTKPNLLNNTCYGCHTGVNTGADFPFVFQTTSPSAGTTLAGGNFYWVASTIPAADDANGHNVEGIADQTTRTPPGGSVSFDVLTCSGTRGCHGDRSIANDYQAMNKTHHSNSPQLRDGISVPTSYRFLNGVRGIQDNNWEYGNPTSSDHNQYYGVGRTSGTSTGGTISNFCASCHGLFHSTAGVSDGGSFTTDPWLRHPTDFDMNQSVTSDPGSELAGYGGAGNQYSILAPVASDFDIVPGVQSTVLQNQGDAIVMCLTCHRAHASQYAGALRWNYREWPANGAANGCGECHTSKN